ncbi:MAG TPA: hypothetical protein VG148_11045 [Pyrinomonadaceae bacterium]|nr:hypothetical protein [Pyrinomonadaceae bacterium]
MTDPVRTDEKKCAHQQCQCLVAGEKRYCSHYCEDAADTDPTSVCTCGHPGCG